MNRRKTIPTKSLKLDLKNYRLPNQKDELSAVSNLVSHEKLHFIGLLKRITQEGNTGEGTIVIEIRGKEKIVREGNCRITIFKMLTGEIPVPKNADKRIHEMVNSASAAIKSSAAAVSCLVYKQTEKEEISAILSRVHGYDDGDHAGIHKWSSVAKARFRRDEKNKPAPELDLFESYLENGENLTIQNKQEWLIDYPLPMLKDLLSKLTKRLNIKNLETFSKKYPNDIKYRKELEALIHRIGRGDLSYDTIRGLLPDSATGAAFDFAGIPDSAPQSSKPADNKQTEEHTENEEDNSGDNKEKTKRRPTQAPPTFDPRSVKSFLGYLNITGQKREKISQLRFELSKITIGEKSILIFCLALRSLIEMSVRVWASENGIQIYGPDSEEKNFKSLIREVQDAYALKPGADKGKIKILSSAIGAFTDKKKPVSWGWLSDVNHNYTAHPSTDEVCIGFHKVKAIIELLNE